MTSGDDSGQAANCQRCGVALESCGFCGRDECPDPLCYRCVRVALGQEVPQPHHHGG